MSLTTVLYSDTTWAYISRIERKYKGDLCVCMYACNGRVCMYVSMLRYAALCYAVMQ